MLTKEDIEALLEAFDDRRFSVNGSRPVPMDDLVRLALLGLAVRESGVTAEDFCDAAICLDRGANACGVDDAEGDRFAEAAEKMDALAKALGAGR